MDIVRQDRRRAWTMVLPLAAVLACFLASASLAGAGSGKFEGWEIEHGVDVPSYAVIDPMTTDLNIDSVVLVCEEAGARRGLQFQLYLTNDLSLSPEGPSSRALKDEPRAEIEIDGRIFPVGIYFAGDYVVLADEEMGRIPVLSEGLLDATESGQAMTLRFDLVAEGAEQPAAFDGRAVIDLQAGVGGAAVAAVRRCAAPAGNPHIGRSRPRTDGAGRGLRLYPPSASSTVHWLASGPGPRP